MKVSGDQGDLSSAFQFPQPNITESHPSKRALSWNHTLQVHLQYFYISAADLHHMAGGFCFSPPGRIPVRRYDDAAHIPAQLWQRFRKKKSRDLHVNYVPRNCSWNKIECHDSLWLPTLCVTAELTLGRCKMVIGSNRP